MGIAHAQNNCVLNGPFECSGGRISGIDFGKDEDDDTFEYYETVRDSDTNNATCIMLQEGTYSVKNDLITAKFKSGDDNACLIGGEDPDSCQCVSTLEMTISNNCAEVRTPDGDLCVAVTDCEDQFSCKNGEDPVPDPSYIATANGCGPSSIPITGPSFSFAHCCEIHDKCYGTCGSSKVECDNDFYNCMSCSCRDEYTIFLFKLTCEEVACTYYQAVDEWGCSSFKNGQNNSCMCPNDKKSVRKQLTEEPMSKFGPIAPTMRSTIICDVPFEAECENYESANVASSLLFSLPLLATTLFV